MEMNHTYFQSQAFALPTRLVTCYFSRSCHAGVHNVRLLTKEMLPQELRRDDPTHIFLTLGGPKPVDSGSYVGSFGLPIFQYGVPSQKATDKNKEFREQHLDYETLNSIIQLLTLEPLFPERNDALQWRLDLGPIYDLINLPVPTNERLKHIREMRAKTVALEDYQVQRSPHYELVFD